MSAAFDSNTTVTVEIGFTSNPTVAVGSTTWTDVTSDVRSFETHGGKTYQADRYEAGTATVVLNNRHRKYDPANTTGTYYPNVVPMRRIRIRAVNGGTTYDLFSGFIDSWKQSYVKGPTAATGDALVTVSATDGFKVLALANLASTAYKTAVLADSPSAYYRLGERPLSGGNVASFADSSGNSNTLTMQGGTTSPTLGVDGALVTDVDTAATFTGSSYLQATNRWLTGTGAYTIEFWFKVPVSLDQTDGVRSYLVQQDPGGQVAPMTTTIGVGVYVVNNTSGGETTGTIVFAQGLDNGTFFGQASSAVYNDGLWHHYVVTRAAGGTVYTAYVDGVQIWTGTAGTTGNNTNTSGSTPQGSFIAASPVTPPSPPLMVTQRGYSLDEVAIYSSALSAARILAHYQAGANFGTAALSGTRVGTVLDTISWPSADRNVDAGNSTMIAVTSSLTDTAALSHLQDVELSENGALYMQPDGKVRFRARQTVLTAAASTTSQATFGDGGGSELPYSDLELDESDEYIKNYVTVTPSGGTGPQTAEDSTSQGTYMRRSYSRTIMVSSNGEATDAANWLLSHYKDAAERVAGITINPRRSTLLWPQVLGRVFGDRITVKRRPPGGGTKSNDVLIEGVAHHVDFGNKLWETRWELTPAETQAYWVLGTAALGTDSRLGY